MKKMSILLVTSFSAAHAAHHIYQQEESYFFKKGGCTQEFLKGLTAGALAGMSVEYIRNHLPDITTWDLHGSYGICRDQLTGQAKVATAALGIAAVNKEHYSKFRLLGAQLVGIIVGACAASYVCKLLASQLPLPPVQ